MKGGAEKETVEETEEEEREGGSEEVKQEESLTLSWVFISLEFMERMNVSKERDVTSKSPHEAPETSECRVTACRAALR